jgi:hypothetical protein
MDWQQAVSLGIVAVTAAGFGVARWRRRKFDFTRDTHCGCVGARAGGVKGSIVYHARKGGRPRIIVKMR